MIYNRRLMAIEGMMVILVDGRISYFSVLQLLRSTVGFSDTSSNNTNHNNLYFISDYQVYHLSLSTSHISAILTSHIIIISHLVKCIKDSHSKKKKDIDRRLDINQDGFANLYSPLINYSS